MRDPELNIPILEPRLCRQAPPALLRGGAEFCKAKVLVFPAGLEGWETRESETAVENGEK